MFPLRLQVLDIVKFIIGENEIDAATSKARLFEILEYLEVIPRPEPVDCPQCSGILNPIQNEEEFRGWIFICNQDNHHAYDSFTNTLFERRNELTKPQSFRIDKMFYLSHLYLKGVQARLACITVGMPRLIVQGWYMTFRNVCTQIFIHDFLHRTVICNTEIRNMGCGRRMYIRYILNRIPQEKRFEKFWRDVGRVWPGIGRIELRYCQECTPL